MDERTFSAFSTIALTYRWAGKLYQSFVCATLSKAMITYRWVVCQPARLFESIGIDNFTDIDDRNRRRFFSLCLQTSKAKAPIMAPPTSVQSGILGHLCSSVDRRASGSPRLGLRLRMTVQRS
jgi:hypothetical protein